MRIAIVNDLMMAVEALRRVINAAPGHEVAWIALNGREAVEKCRVDRPDLILMDLIMPVMDGVQATAEIMCSSPCSILVVTATVEGNAAKVFEAMGYGALDAVCTPNFGAGNTISGGDELLKKITTIAKLMGKAPVEKKAPDVPAPSAQGVGDVPPLIAIGSSTGGPRVLADILGFLPARPGAAIVIIQHVDSQFAGGLTHWLDSQCNLPVQLALENMPLAKDTVYVAGTNDHLVLGSDRCLHYTPEPRDYPYRPSVDEFFASLARYWPRRDMAVLLTGMGRDGARGLLSLRRSGWHTIAQSEASCIIYGMPRAAAELDAAVEILPPADIAEVMLKFATRGITTEAQRAQR